MGTEQGIGTVQRVETSAEHEGIIISFFSFHFYQCISYCERKIKCIVFLLVHKDLGWDGNGMFGDGVG